MKKFSYYHPVLKNIVFVLDGETVHHVSYENKKYDVVPKWLEKQLNSYFSEQKPFSLSVDRNVFSSDFQSKVLLFLPSIKQCSYKDLAEKIGYPNAYRAVGSALKKNPLPLIVPCHRVIKSNNEIGYYAGSSDNTIKKYLLSLEENKLVKHKIKLV